MHYDPKLPKKLSIFFAASYPAWQDEYIELVRQNFDATTLEFNEEVIMKGIKVKGGKEVKRGMTFWQGLKRSVKSGEAHEEVFERKLAFDEQQVLGFMVAGLRKTTGCRVVEVIKVDGEEGEKVGTLAFGMDQRGKIQGAELPGAAGGAVPGVPSFHFENIRIADGE